QMQRYASLVAERLVLQNGLPRPRSWPGAQRDLQPLELVRGANPEMASTYLVGDELGPGAGQPDGYSVFYMAGFEARSGYTPFYSEVHDYRRTGKVAPRFVDHLNWNGQEGQEVLLQVYEANGSRYAAVGADGSGRWAKRWEGPRCTEGATPRAR
ncbi:MAG: hypothetical protein M3409_09325, partial [Gemmatimonadota bacterium]|nr:hypothetical protein [Gemmatimonadota bacterium]